IASGSETNTAALICRRKVRVDVEIIQQSRAVCRLVRRELLQVVLDKRNTTMRVAVDRIAPWLIARPRSPTRFDVLLRIKIVPPILDNGPTDFRSWIGSLNPLCRGQPVVGYFVVRRRQRMHIAMYCIPPRRLIVQIVDGHATTGGRTKLAHKIADPITRERWPDRNAGVRCNTARNVGLVL